MRRYLVVAHRTLGGEHLMEHLRQLRAEHGDCQFHLVVPVFHPTDRQWTEGQVEAAARDRLDEILEIVAEMGIGADGEIGDASPVYAVDTVLRREGHDAFAGIILSTLPQGVSRWWNMDVPGRLNRAHPEIPITHIVAESATV